MKIVYFNYAAAATLAVVLFSARVRKVGVALANKAFIATAFEVLMTTVFDIMAVYFDNLGPGNVAAKYFFHAGYLILHTLTAEFYLFYLISLTDTWHRYRKSRKLFLVLSLPSAIYILLQVIGWLGGPSVFYISEAGVYTRSTTFFAGYIVGAFYLVYGIYYIVRYRKLFTPTWILTLFTPYPFIAGAMVAEYFHPQLLIELFFNALGIAFVYANIQKPEELTDVSTGLGNSGAYEAYCKRAFFNGKPFSAIILDMRNFHIIQDVLDFKTSSEFKRGCAEFIREVSRKLKLYADIFYLQNGRFVLLVDEFFAANVPLAADVITERFNSVIPVGTKEVRPHTAVCTATLPEDIPSFDAFMRFSENRLYGIEVGELKAAGDLMKDDQYRVLINIDRIVSEALSDDHLEVYYQPIYNVAEKDFSSCEALLRLKDPEFGFVSPEIFIPAAERSGYIDRIWDFVIGSVCRFAASPDFASLGVKHIEVNLSANQCMKERLAPQIISQIDKTGADKGLISLEITETAVARNASTLEKNLRQLNSAGMTICLDDYGVGYSNTRRIMDLPIGIVKLDKSLLDGIETERIRSIVRDTVGMLKDLGASIVAEGVETKEMLDTIVECGADLIQGYYFSRPLPEKDFAEFCRERN